MSKLAGLTGVQGGMIAGAAVVVIMGGAAWYSGAFAPGVPAPQPEKVALLPQAEETPEPAAAPEPKSEPVTAEPQTTEPEVQPEAEPETAKAEAAAPDVMQPAFDLVRVEKDGSATIAGRADPGVEVLIELDGQEASRATTGGDGSFVQFMKIEPSTEPRLVRLMVEGVDGQPVYSADSAVIAPMLQVAAVEPEKVEPAAREPEADPVEVETPKVAEAPVVSEPEMVEPEPEPVVQAVAEAPQVEPVEIVAVEPEVVAEPVVQAPTAGSSDPEPETSPEPVVETVQVTEPTASEPAAGEPEVASDKMAEPAQLAAVEPEIITPPEPQAPAVIIAGTEGVKVVQPLARAPEVMSAVALDTISYTDQGEVQLAGRGQGSGFVRVYVDNRPVTTSRIAADGNWRSDLPDVDTGVYTLRVDEIDTEGQVVSRVETPFKREAQEVVAEAGQAKVITVQPGHTLWAIATDNYGEGNLYVRLYEANKDRIRNPDLIYPGQVFDIPGE
ncbi:LysM peptidoglycan-binding domain-containing protein [Alisedimentitalea sp. MJ-SS2]|uniref:LysM peptidoglycan-binding domain-containing protein n=1 Tax=Aliisedimentitalea sp. MJ-SS2 TaxID=3049795 RepID=UPI0029122964|nr:LysM peptidoglycan-binding domain-containing protein [Alisedimentitalea sp. MJ-SS2]MDU8928943.1 LysM peptidoglycan-binding domain-containing protein [Alisedimentitalea sp. MJ-SS2]